MSSDWHNSRSLEIDNKPNETMASEVAELSNKKLRTTRSKNPCEHRICLASWSWQSSLSPRALLYFKSNLSIVCGTSVGFSLPVLLPIDFAPTSNADVLEQSPQTELFTVL